MTEADLNRAMQQMAADPQVQAALEQWKAYHARTGSWSDRHGVGSFEQAFHAAADKYLPPGTQVTFDPKQGPVVRNKGLPSWVYPLAIGAIGLTAGAAAGAFTPVVAAAPSILGTAAPISAFAPSAAAPAAVGGIPTLASTAIGTGMGSTPTVAGGLTGSALAGGGGLSAGSILKTAGAVGNALGANAAGRARGRVDESGIQQDQDRLALDRYRALTTESANQNAFNLSSTNALNSFNQNESQGLNAYNTSTNQAENAFGLNRVNAGINLADADLRQRQFGLTAPGQRAGNAVRGDILANARDVSFAGLPAGITPPTISGGLRPSMFSDNTRALGGELSSQALAGQRAGDHFAPLPALPDYLKPKAYQGTPYVAPSPYQSPSAPPGLTPLSSSGKLDSILNTAGAMGSIADLLARYKGIVALPPGSTAPPGARS